MHERFGKSFRAFQLRGCFRGSKNFHGMRTKLIHNACGQWGLRPHHREIDFFLLRPFAQCLHIGDRHIDQIGVARCAAISWRYKHFLNAL